MSIVTISRGSYSRGKEVAEKVAEELGYECIARDVIIEASKEFNVPEVKLVRAIHDAPSIFDRIVYGKEKYVAYFKAALLKRLQKGNVVYHGLAGHFFLKGVSHVLKVRIIADIEDRVKLEMEREGISRKEALRILKSDDEERRKWSKHLYGIDTWDPNLYDLVIHIRKITADDAVDIICHAVGLKHFQVTPESQGAMDDLVAAAEVQAALIELRPDVQVSVHDGVVHVQTEGSGSQEEELLHKMEDIAKKVPGVKGFEVHVVPIPYYGD
jgi:cytidylate kinase